MKSVNKILTIFASACFTLSSCDIDPVLTSSYPDDITWSNETNLQLYINGFYSLMEDIIQSLMMHVLTF